MINIKFVTTDLGLLYFWEKR